MNSSRIRAHSGTPVLGMAAAVATPAALRLLILAGADLEAAGDDGLTPLILARQYRQPENARILQEAGAVPRSHADLHAMKGQLDA